MPVENKDVIDIVSIDSEEKVNLTITDSLMWDTENEHLLILQDKINSYLTAVESGDLYVMYPNAVNRDIVIRIISLHHPNEDGIIFLERVKEIVENAGYGFSFKQQLI